MTAKDYPEPPRDALWISNSSSHLDRRQGTHPSPQKTCFHLRSPNRTTTAHAKSCYSPLGMVTQPALSKPLAETACLRVVISYNLCVGWFAKIRKSIFQSWNIYGFFTITVYFNS